MFTVYALGFVLYPYRIVDETETECPFLAVPSVGRHQAFVVVNGTRIDLDERKSVSLSGFDCNGQPLTPKAAAVMGRPFVNGLPPEPAQPGSWENFNLIPDVESFMARPCLRQGWAESLLLKLDLIGGEITALPDAWTLEQKWRWDSGHRQVVSSLTRYSVPGLDRGTLSVDGKGYDLTSKSEISIFNVAAIRNETSYDRYMRGMDHHLSVLSFCDPATNVNIQNPLNSEPANLPVRIPNTEYDKVAKLLAGQAGAAAPVGIGLDAGYPSCCGRKLRFR